MARRRKADTLDAGVGLIALLAVGLMVQYWYIAVPLAVLVVTLVLALRSTPLKHELACSKNAPGIKTYFLQLDGGGREIKIGKTRQTVDQRVTQIDSTGTPYPIKVIAVMLGDHERELHRRFAAYRSRNNREWFRPGPELLQYIEQLNNPPVSESVHQNNVVRESVQWFWRVAVRLAQRVKRLNLPTRVRNRLVCVYTSVTNGVRALNLSEHTRNVFGWAHGKARNTHWSTYLMGGSIVTCIALIVFVAYLFANSSG